MKKQTLIYLSGIILLLIVSVTYFLLRPQITFVKDMDVLEREERYHYMDLIEYSDGEITVDREYLDTEKTGRKVFIYRIKNSFFQRKVKYRYEVIDTRPPIIEIHQDVIYKEPYEPYDEEMMKKNVSVNEGTLSFETDHDPSFCGEYQVRVTARDESDNVSEGFYKVVVADTEKPMIFHSGNGTMIRKGRTFSAESIISYGDNADPDPTLKVDGEVDTSVCGDYLLHASLTDDSGNITQWNLTVKVVEDISYDESERIFYDFADFRDDYAGEGRKFGIDISTWQGDVDFEAVRDAGCEFVIMRIGYSYLGELTLDTRFEENIKGATEAGLPVGIYLYSYDNNEEELLKALEAVFELTGEYELEYGIAFDWEDFGEFPEYQMSFQMLNHLYDIFERKVSEKGYRPILYGSAYYLKNIWKNTDNRAVWLAHYTAETTYDGPYEMWQRCSNGRIDGIEGYVDFDIIGFGKQ